LFVINLVINQNLNTMKNIKKILFVFLAVSLFAVANSNAQIVVNIRPNRPERVAPKPPRPSSRHVWVDEGWTIQGNKYVYRPGYWAVPPRGKKAWVAGRWSTRGKVNVWVEGHWS